MLDLHRLTLLREVKLRGSMTAAARELSYSHSAISQQLSLLEREAGVRLLERAGRNVRLTPAAEELVRNTEAILAAMERAEADLAATRHEPKGEVRLAAFSSISRSVVPRALAALASAHPGLRVGVSLADPEVAAVRLTSRQADAVLTDAYPGTERLTSSGVTVTTLGGDPVRGYLPSVALEGDLDAVRDVPWVLEPPQSASAQWARRVCRELGFEPKVAHVSADLLFHLRMVEHGLAAAFLPDMILRETGSALAPSRWLPSDQERSIHLVVRAGAESNPAIVALRDALQTAFDAQLG
ncbi:LysR family transcriptional regulator [Gulosibacter sp. 10]|uniref:LysR family transcriptional regulator n=1 Tax=Gulosibacter sp. 10 TaxID=1255570 RepID=UPI00097EE89B|nr:LysR family transcriptional regulator [Gulosibacter sp. 10]SJM71828.1 Transcriptional regulator, LysR family [Gulosibacter sp. 10]